MPPQDPSGARGRPAFGLGQHHPNITPGRPPRLVYLATRWQLTLAVELISELVLRSIAAHESKGRNGPTLDDVAADLGIPPVFGYDRLNERLQRQVVLGRVSSDGEHFRLTATGRLAVSA